MGSTYKRILAEIQEVNRDFHSLRTLIQPDPDGSLRLFYFVMIPNDGALAHQTLIGKLVFKDTYPEYPPLIHLFTATGRYNVDMYRSRLQARNPSGSTMCFDILRSRMDGGTWSAEYTVSCLFASLMQALVSTYVPQEYGGEKEEFVSMERLAAVKKYVAEAFRLYGHLIPRVPEIPTIEAAAIAARPFTFPTVDATTSSAFTVKDLGREATFTSAPIFLQTNDPANTHTVKIDLSNLHGGIIFSVILSNKCTDFQGRQKDTILIRNGVTGTAAKKRADGYMRWFYHGKPLNDGSLIIAVTVTDNQFTIAYETEKGYVVHGDCPISYLTPAEIGDVAGVPFYLTIFMKAKYGKPVSLPILTDTTNPLGYVHDPACQIIPPLDGFELWEVLLRKAGLDGAEERSASASDKDEWDIIPRLESLSISPPRRRTPLFVKLSITANQTAALAARLKNHIASSSLPFPYTTEKSRSTPAHLTLCFSKDLPRDDFERVVRDVYEPLAGQTFSIHIEGWVADRRCAAYITSAPEGVPVYPQGKACHLTMFLADGVKPVYSNELIQRAKENLENGVLTDGEKLEVFKEGWDVDAVLEVVYKGPTGR
ncbi:hypothetical protein HK104_001917 [Borealophlyctis nickersoniae]|nr:hypothetical protein HK104_001917 [Borealophlyctis nickersoniae]